MKYYYICIIQQKESIIIKIALIGKGGVGKSSLINRLFGRELPKEYEPTIEDRYKNEVILEDKLYTIEILDTAGEEGDFQNVMNMWISFGQGFLLVFAINNKESFDIIRSKRELIIKEKKGEIPPMILVGNKQDCEKGREVAYDEAKSLADSWGIEYIETSAKNNFNCKKAFAKLALKISEPNSNQKSSCFCLII